MTPEREKHMRQIAGEVAEVMAALAIEQARVALDQRDAAIREARAKALEEAAEALTSHDITSDIGEQLADTNEARAWLRDRAARERGTKRGTK